MNSGNHPVLVGAAQLIENENDPRETLHPLAMLERIAREAAEDARCGDTLLRAVDTIGLVQIVGWKARNAPQLLAERIGARPRREIITRSGGNISMSLVNRTAERILAGECQVAFLAGANNMRTLKLAQRAGVKLDWPLGGTREPEFFGGERAGSSELEIRHGLGMPVSVYPCIENALCAKRGTPLEEHRHRLGELFAPFTEIAARNPYAHFPVARSAHEISEVTPENRMISYPYTKYMNAVLATDQAAGVFLLSSGKARALGIPEERWLYWWGGADVNEKAWHVSERPDIADSRAMRACAERTFTDTGLSIEEIDWVDFYSCFPVAVEMACQAYGIAENDSRGLTVTGGLPYAGGPASNYPMHSLATMATRLREHPGNRGLVTGNGWYLTKHSSCVWSSEPGGRPVQPEAREWDDEQADLIPVEVVEEASGDATVDTFTVGYGRDGTPDHGITIAHLDDGRRCVARMPPDRDLLAALIAEETIGRRGIVENADGINTLTFR